MNNKRIAVVVLNWNGWKDTIECLESLTKTTYPNSQIIVVDNGSTDGSIERIRSWAGEKKAVPFLEFDANNISDNNDADKVKLVILKLDKNLGYARGNNAGARFACDRTSAEFIFILNNDTVVSADALEPLVKVFDIGDKVALAGPKIIDYNTGKFWQGPAIRRLGLFSYLIFLTPLNRFFVRTLLMYKNPARGDKPIKVYGIPGCAMFFKKDHFRKIGFYDEATFLYWEEYIIAEKLLSSGFDTFFVPASRVLHKVGNSTRNIDTVEKTLYTLQTERYFQKNYLKMPLFERSIIRWVRTAIYYTIALFNSSYRKNMRIIMKELKY